MRSYIRLIRVNADALSRNSIRNDKQVYNVQAKEREDNTKEDKEGILLKNIRKKRNSKYYMSIMMHPQRGIKGYYER